MTDRPTTGAAAGTARLLMLSTLRAGAEAEYERIHARVPDAVAEALVRAGVAEYTIWREGRTLVHLVEAVDPHAALDAAAADPVIEEWNHRMDRLVESFATSADGGFAMPELWRLGAQVPAP